MSMDDKPIPEHLRRLSLLATHAFVESGLHGIDAEVVLALEVSRLMAPLYISGMLRELVDHLFTLSLCFDDDGVVPAWAFAHEAEALTPLTRAELEGWMDREITSHPGRFRADCSYAPVLEAICRRYFPREWALPQVERKIGGALKRTVREYPSLIDQRPFPIFVIVVTGGDCDDPTETLRVIQRASHLPIFFQFAGISLPGIAAPEFTFLRRLDRLPDRHVDNCGFFEPRDFREPRDLFVGLLNEFPDYLAEERVSAMLLPPDDDPPLTVASLALERELPELPEDDLEAREAERLARLARRRERAQEQVDPVGPEAPPRRVQPMTRPYGSSIAGPGARLEAPPTGAGGPMPGARPARTPVPAGSEGGGAPRGAATPTTRAPRPQVDPRLPPPSAAAGPAPPSPPRRVPVPRRDVPHEVAPSPRPAPRGAPGPTSREEAEARLALIRARRAARRGEPHDDDDPTVQ